LLDLPPVDGLQQPVDEEPLDTPEQAAARHYVRCDVDATLALNPAGWTCRLTPMVSPPLGLGSNLTTGPGNGVHYTSRSRTMRRNRER
jgi:hypothetical protein